jgi:hypothetical protein
VELEGNSSLVVPVSVSEQGEGCLVGEHKVQVLVESESPAAIELNVLSDGLLELERSVVREVEGGAPLDNQRMSLEPLGLLRGIIRDLCKDGML